MQIIDKSVGFSVEQSISHQGCLRVGQVVSNDGDSSSVSVPTPGALVLKGCSRNLQPACANSHCLRYFPQITRSDKATQDMCGIVNGGIMLGWFDLLVWVVNLTAVNFDW